MILSRQICDDLLKLNNSLCVDVQYICIYWCIISFNSVKTLKTLRNWQTNNWIKTLLLSFILVCSTFYHLQWFHAISINHHDWPRQWLLIIHKGGAAVFWWVGGGRQLVIQLHYPRWNDTIRASATVLAFSANTSQISFKKKSNSLESIPFRAASHTASRRLSAASARTRRLQFGSSCADAASSAINFDRDMHISWPKWCQWSQHWSAPQASGSSASDKGEWT